MSDHTKVTFKTFYHTDNTDHVVAVVGSTICLGSWNPAKSLILTEDKNTGTWAITTKLQVGGQFDWKLAILDKRHDKVVQWEDVPNRFLMVGKLPIEIETPWNGKEQTRCVSPSTNDNKSTQALLQLPSIVVKSASNNSSNEFNVTFKISFEPGSHNECVAVTGNDKNLGSWNPLEALVCEPFGKENCWRTSVQLAENSVHEWKLVCLDRDTRHILRWEDGPNRRIYIEQSSVEVISPWDIKEVVRYSRPPNVILTPLERKSSDLDCSRKPSTNNNAIDLADKNKMVKVVINVEHDAGNSGVVLYVAGSCEPLGYWDPSRAIRLSQQENRKNWHGTFCVSKHSSFEWKLLMLNKDVPVWEGRPNRCLDIQNAGVEVFLRWNETEQTELLPASIFDFVEVSFKTRYYLGDSEVIAVSGSSGNVGLWDTREALILDKKYKENHWSSKTLFVVDEDVEWKLVVLDRQTHHVKRWEECNNRLLRIGNSSLEVIVPWGTPEAIREVYTNPRQFLTEDDITVDCKCNTCNQSEVLEHPKPDDDDGDASKNNNDPTVRAIIRTNYHLDIEDTSVAIAGSCANLGRWNLENALLFNRCPTKGDPSKEEWSLTTSLPMAVPFEWKMLIMGRTTREALVWENRENRRLTINSSGIEVNVQWNSMASIKSTSGRSSQTPVCISCEECTKIPSNTSDDYVEVTLKSNYVCYNTDHALAVIGSHTALGCWRPENAAIMTTSESQSSWETTVGLPLNINIRWKLVLVEKQTSRVVRWEEGDDRFLRIEKNALDIFAPWNNQETIRDTNIDKSTDVDMAIEQKNSPLKPVSCQLKVKKSVHFASNPVSECKLFMENENDCVTQTFASYSDEWIRTFLE